MKKFDEMNEAEQKAVLLEKAQSIPGMANRKLEWLAYTHNAVFLTEFSGKPCILKMAVHDRLERHNAVVHEMDVLYELSKTTLAGKIPSLHSQLWTARYELPEDIPALRGQSSKHVNVVFYDYLQGEQVQIEAVNASDIAAIGKFLAELHCLKLAGLAGLKALPKLDFDGMFSNRYPLTEASKALFSPQQLNVMDTVALPVKSAMDELGQGESEFGLIHGDLLLKNILFHEGEVRALDFEYCGWGYYLYDLCPLLWQLKPLSNYKELEEALWQGYTSIRPLTERHRQLLETFIAGRQVASMRWVAANQHNPAYQGKVAGILQQRTAELQGFLETGILTRS